MTPFWWILQHLGSAGGTIRKNLSDKIKITSLLTNAATVGFWRWQVSKFKTIKQTYVFVDESRNSLVVTAEPGHEVDDIRDLPPVSTLQLRLQHVFAFLLWTRLLGVLMLALGFRAIFSPDVLFRLWAAVWYFRGTILDQREKNHTYAHRQA